MPVVCIVGGGTAGIEAAREASRLGAGVVVLERAPGPAPRWESWPSLLSRRGRTGVSSPPGAPVPRSVGVCLGAAVESVRGGTATTESGRRVRADAFVIASGSRSVWEPFRGERKEGVWVLDSAARYSGLAECLGSLPRAVVAGEGIRGMEVSERLSGEGLSVTLLVSRWQGPPPSPPVLAVLREAAERIGVKVGLGPLDRAVGTRAVEAVLTSGRVLQCDALVVVPARSPGPVPAGARTGRNGGIIVDRWLRSSAKGVFAAGGCAALADPPSEPSSLVGRGGVSGRAAGANAAGRAAAVGTAALWMGAFFGLRWWRAGAAPSLFPGPPNGVRVFCHRWDPETACSVAYHQGSGAVVGAEGVAPKESTRFDHAVIAPSSTLHTLAYGSSVSSDISVLSDTARLALARWQGS